jgi:hypothetical protein
MSATTIALAVSTKNASHSRHVSKPSCCPQTCVLCDLFAGSVYRCLQQPDQCRVVGRDGLIHSAILTVSALHAQALEQFLCESKYMKLIQRVHTQTARWLAISLSSLILAACGGGGGGGGGSPAPQVSLTASVSGFGQIQSSPAGLSCTNASDSCVASFDQNTTVTLTATPATNQRFVEWSGACSGPTATCVIVMSEARSVSAGFEPAPGVINYTLTVNLSGNGSVASNPAGITCGSDCTEAYAANTQVTLNATPAANQSFVGWGGACSGASSCVVTMNEIKSVSATFAPVTAARVTLTTVVSGTGSVSSNPAGIDCGAICNAQFDAGTSVTLTAAPAAGQVFNGWAGACSGAQLTCQLSMTQSRSAQANFVTAPPPATAWQAPLRLESSDDFNVAATNRFTSGRMLTAIGPNGHAMVIWEQSDGTPNGSTVKAFSRRYTPGVGWESAVAVPGMSKRDFDLVNGYLFVDGSGTATWIENITSATRTYSTRRNTLSGGWQTPFALSAPGGANFFISSAIMDANGAVGILAVVSGSNIFNIALNSGASQWGNWTQVSASQRNVFTTKVALSSNGTALAIWSEVNPGDNNYSMKASRFDPSQPTGWQPPVVIDSSFDNVQAAYLDVAIDAQGNGVAIWAQGNFMYYNMFTAASGWQGAVQFDNQVGSALVEPQVGMTPDGRAVALWGSGQAALRSMQYTPQGGWTAPETIDNYNIRRMLSISDNGRAVVTYSPFTDPATLNFDVVTRSLQIGGSWSSVVKLDVDAGNVKTPIFAMNKNGQGIAIWVQDDLANSSVRNSLWGALLR